MSKRLELLERQVEDLRREQARVEYSGRRWWELEEEIAMLQRAVPELENEND